MVVIGKKQLEQLAGFTASAIAYGLASAITTVYLTDWLPVVTFIPYYNGKFRGKKKPDSGC